VSTINEVADPDEFDEEAYVMSMPDWQITYYLFEPTYYVHNGTRLHRDVKSVAYRKIIAAKSKAQAKKLFYNFIRSLPPVEDINGNPVPQEQHMRISGIYQVPPIKESDNEVDPERYLDTAFDSPVEGYTVERGSHTVSRFGNLGKDPLVVYSPEHKAIGYILYDPQDDVPANANPEWKELHYLSSAGSLYPDQFHKTFDEAVLRLIKLHRDTGRAVAETLLEAEIPTNPDDVDPEYYLGEINPGVTELKTELSKLYDKVKIHVRKPTMPTFYPNTMQWVVSCRRDRPMPYPALYTRTDPHNTPGHQFRQIVELFFGVWAKEVGLVMSDFKTHGTLRKSVTFTFIARPENDPLLFMPTRTEESDGPDDPDSFMPGFLDKHEWEKELMNLLWEWHPTGVGYNVAGAPHASIVTAWTYFDPATHDFANGMYDLVLNYFRQRGFNPTSLNMWTWKQAEDNYPRWSVMIVLNAPAWNALNEPPVRSLT
jgi:hypothetical protein